MIGYKDKLLAMQEDDTVVTRAYTGKTCRVLRNEYTNDFDAAGAKAEPFPGQYIKSLKDGANHLGGDMSTPDVNPDREFMPAGQGGGAINELVPAGEMVARFVAQAEAALARVDQAR